MKTDIENQLPPRTCYEAFGKFIGFFLLSFNFFLKGVHCSIIDEHQFEALVIAINIIIVIPYCYLSDGGIDEDPFRGAPLDQKISVILNHLSCFQNAHLLGIVILDGELRIFTIMCAFLLKMLVSMLPVTVTILFALWNASTLQQELIVYIVTCWLTVSLRNL